MTAPTPDPGPDPDGVWALYSPSDIPEDNPPPIYRTRADAQRAFDRRTAEFLELRARGGIDPAAPQWLFTCDSPFVLELIPYTEEPPAP